MNSSSIISCAKQISKFPDVGNEAEKSRTTGPEIPAWVKMASLESFVLVSDSDNVKTIDVPESSRNGLFGIRIGEREGAREVIECPISVASL